MRRTDSIANDLDDLKDCEMSIDQKLEALKIETLLNINQTLVFMKQNLRKEE